MNKSKKSEKACKGKGLEWIDVSGKCVVIGLTTKTACTAAADSNIKWVKQFDQSSATSAVQMSGNRNTSLVQTLADGSSGDDGGLCVHFVSICIVPAFSFFCI